MLRVYDGVVKSLENNKYMVYVKIQDGTEVSGPFDTIDDALEDWKKGHKVMNGAKRKKKECKCYEEVQVTTTELKELKNPRE